MGNESYEFVSEKDEAVARLVGSLPSVEAPGDFDTRVRARIAAGQPASRSWLPVFARIAVPAAVLLAIGGYFGYYALYQTQPTAPAVADSRQTESAPVVVNPSAPPSNNELTAAPQQPQREENSPRSSQPSQTTDRPGGGSLEDQAVRETRRILPRGFDTNTQVTTNANTDDGGAKVTAKDLLDIIGVNAEFTSAGWKVGSLRPNNMAERAGVRAGDVIEAINDRPLNEKTEFGRTFNGTSLRVRRDGRSIKLDLKP